MKKSLISLGLLVLVLTHCHKSNDYPSPPPPPSEIFTEEFYNYVTQGAADPNCKESDEMIARLASKGMEGGPNKNWYYTYENFSKAFAEYPKFINTGDENTKKLELAAFFAHISQETGTHSGLPEHNDAGCFISEVGQLWNTSKFGGTSPTTGAGFLGRGPLQISWDYNYTSYGQETGQGDKYYKDPEALAYDPVTGIKGALWFWFRTNEKPSPHDVITGNWTPTANDIAAGRKKETAFGVTTNIINGGIECHGAATREPQRRADSFKFFAKHLGADSSSIDQDANCANQYDFATHPS